MVHNRSTNVYLFLCRLPLSILVVCLSVFHPCIDTHAHILASHQLYVVFAFWRLSEFSLSSSTAAILVESVKMKSSEPEAVQAILDYSVPSLCLTSADVRRVCKLAEVAKRFLHLEACRSVHERQYHPIAEVLIQDTTPLKTSTVHVGTSARLVRKGRSCKEWLVQRLFLFDMHGDKRALFVDPVDMDRKSASSHHVAGVRLWDGCRMNGHKGILISHGVWDRAVHSACARLMQQRHTALRVHFDAVMGEAESTHLWLQHWTTSAGCGAHDFTNALRWANLHDFGDKDGMRRM